LLATDLLLGKMFFAGVMLWPVTGDETFDRATPFAPAVIAPAQTAFLFSANSDLFSPFKTS